VSSFLLNPDGEAEPVADSIVVRAFEDRTDLLRCMIIGPGP